MALQPGRRLGPYAIQSALGAGGMGEVYRAVDTRLDRQVAIKVLPEDVAGNPDLKQRFEREARTLAALSHPHICPIHDVGSENGIDFLVMEHLEGETLEQRLKRSGLPLDQALHYAIQIADALDKAHGKGIVHRDLKPANVMLTKGGVKLLDFGLAKLQSAGPVAGLSVAGTLSSPLTAQGTILGTLHYMAPEQVEGRDTDARTDIFAFGAVLYEMVTGHKAFDGKSAASVMAVILERHPPQMSSLQPLAPSALDHIVSQCLEKDPDERWQTAGDVMRELKWIAGAPGQGATMATPARHGRRERVAWALLGAAMVGLAILAVPAMLYLRRAEPQPVVTRLEVVTPPSSDPFSFAISPDGRQLAFVASAEGGSRLWLRSFDQDTARPLTGTEGASYPFWSPDTRAIGFFTADKLKRIDLTGGASQVLADVPGARGGTWSRDGVIVFAPQQSVLMQVAATGGTPTALTELAPGEGSHRWPQFLPDGRRFLFYVGLGQPSTHGVYVGSLDGRQPTRLLAGEAAAVYAPPGLLLRVEQGALVAHPFDAERGVVSAQSVRLAQSVAEDDGTFRSAFSVSEAGVLAYRTSGLARRQIVWVDRTGKVTGVVRPPDDARVSSPELTRDGKRIAVHRGYMQGNVDVWLIDVATGVLTQFTFDAANDAGAVWAPDGKRIVFGSSRNGKYGLFEKPSNLAADERALPVTGQDTIPLDWSSDGAFLLYASQDPKTGSDLWALPLVGGSKPLPVVQTRFDERQGQFSADGRWVAYVSNESGSDEVYIQAFPGPGGKRLVSAAGGSDPRWRRDGQELFYVARDNKLMAVSIEIGADRSTLSPGAPVALFQTRFAIGANITLGWLSKPQYAVAPDGRFLMNVTVEDPAAPITIFQNWTTLLKQ